MSPAPPAPGLREALAACRAGDTLVVTKLDRLARPLSDARDLVEDLTPRGVSARSGVAAGQQPTATASSQGLFSGRNAPNVMSGLQQEMPECSCES